MNPEALEDPLKIGRSPPRIQGIGSGIAHFNLPFSVLSWDLYVFPQGCENPLPPHPKKKEKSKSLPGGIGVENDLQLLMYKAVSSKKWNTMVICS